jgi:hypothetical protein
LEWNCRNGFPPVITGQNHHQPVSGRGCQSFFNEQLFGHIGQIGRPDRTGVLPPINMTGPFPKPFSDFGADRHVNQTNGLFRGVQRGHSSMGLGKNNFDQTIAGQRSGNDTRKPHK